MATIGFIGSGHIGSTVAYLAVTAGYDVVLSNSRGPETLKDLVKELGPRARAATGEEAAKAAEIVVVTIPLKAYRDVPVEPLAGKIVIDTMNYYAGRDGHIKTLDDGSSTSSELLQAHLPKSKVVKGFNTIPSAILRALPRKAGAKDRTALPIAGNDAQARAAVTAFFDKIGYDVVDAGALTESWRFQPNTPAYATPYAGKGGFSDPKVAGRDEIRARLNEARR